MLRNTYKASPSIFLFLISFKSSSYFGRSSRIWSYDFYPKNIRRYFDQNCYGYFDSISFYNIFICKYSGSVFLVERISKLSNAILARAFALGFCLFSYNRNDYSLNPLWSTILPKWRQSSIPIFTACQRKGVIVCAASPKSAALSL